MSYKSFVQTLLSICWASEYSALASIADVLPISSLVDVVFYRDITMQPLSVTQRIGRPLRCVPSILVVYLGYSLREVVDSIAVRSGALVNYNVEVCRSLFLLSNLSSNLHYTGPTICMCWRACSSADNDGCLELSKDPGYSYCQGTILHSTNFY
jgi:hypothetical protein